MLQIQAAIGSDPMVVPDGSTATSVVVGMNGRTTIVPASADLDGISMNGYERFSVGASGAEIDNRDVHARLIVNEISGADPSRLEGELAVLGPRAHLVLANPNGLSVNGARFVNTGAIALTTGTVELAGYRPSPDRLRHNVLLHTDRGRIDIGPGGLSGAFTRLELIARTIRVDGPVINEFSHADALIRAMSGASVVEIDSGVSPVDEKSPWTRHLSAGEEHTGVVVDITPLGSLQSGRVEILVTDRGAGVRHAGAAYATHGDVVIDTDGAVQLAGGRIEASGHALIGSTTLHVARREEVPGRVDSKAGMVIFRTEQDLVIEESEVRAAAGVDIEAGSLHVNGAGSTTSLVSDGAGISAKIDGDARLSGADLLARGDILLSTGKNLELRPEAGLSSRVISAEGRLEIDTGGSLNNIGGLLQGQSGGDTDPAVSIRAGTGVSNGSPDAQNLAIIFGAEGDVVIDSAGDITNHTARIVANGNLDLHAAGDVLNLIDKTPEVNDGEVVRDTDTSHVLGLFPKKRYSVSRDFGRPLIPGQLAYMIADGDVDIQGRNVRSVGGEIHANSGDLRIVAEEHIENSALRTGQAVYKKSCFFGCRPKASSTVAMHGGGLVASGEVQLRAGKSVTNQGGTVSSSGTLSVDAPLTTASAIEGYLAVSQSRGLSALFGKGYGRLLRSDVGGLFLSDGDIVIEGGIIIDGGELKAEGQVAIAGLRQDVRAPVREPMPGDIPSGGVFSFLPD